MPERPATSKGTLVLVVGPSGAGKDAMIDGARQRFAGDASYVFPRRYITRPSAPGEDHRPVSTSEFAALAAGGAFLLSWQAHGLNYAVPASIAGDFAAGHTVIVNVSRLVIDEARRRYAPILVIEVTAPEATLAERLKRRGREADAEVAERLQRSQLMRPSGPDVRTIVTDGPLAASVETFCRLLHQTRTIIGRS